MKSNCNPSKSFESIQNNLSGNLPNLLPQLNAFKTVFIEQSLIEKEKNIQPSLLFFFNLKLDLFLNYNKY